MNYVVHLFYKGYVVYCSTLAEALLVTRIKDASHYKVFETTENRESGTELADWAWAFELKEGRHKCRVVEL